MYRLTLANLQPIGDLFRTKKRLFYELMGQLKPSDVKTDNAFRQTVKEIKDQVLLKSVVIHEPTIIDHEEFDKSFNPSYEMPIRHSKKIVVVYLEFPFEGSPELLSAMPENVKVYDDYKYQPEDDEQVIPIEITLQSLDKASALAKAKEEISGTKALIDLNNSQAEHWSKTMESSIDFELGVKREQILSFYS